MFSFISIRVNLIYGMSALVGIGYALVMVSTFSRAHRAAMEKGYNDDIDTYIIISGSHYGLQIYPNYM